MMEQDISNSKLSKLQDHISKLVKIWGEDDEMGVTVSTEDWSPSVYIPSENRVYVTTSVNMDKFTLDYYRILRTTAWHEAMHRVYTHNNYSHITNKLDQLCINVFEDYRIETLGQRVYKGYRDELSFTNNHYVGNILKDKDNNALSINNNITQYATLYVITKLIVPDKSKDVLKKYRTISLDFAEWYDKHGNDLNFIINSVTELEDSELTPHFIEYSGKELARFLEESHEDARNEAVSVDGLKRLSNMLDTLEDAESQKTTSSKDKQEPKPTRGKPNKDIQSEFDEIFGNDKESSHNQETQDMDFSNSTMNIVQLQSSAEGIAYHSELIQKYSPMVKSIKHTIQQLKRTYVDRLDDDGTEIDIDEFITSRATGSNQYYMDDKKLKPPKNIAMLCDASGSMGSEMHNFHVVLACLGHIFNELHMNYNITGFDCYNKLDVKDKNVRIQSCKQTNEPHSTNVMSKLINLNTGLYTPLNTVIKNYRDEFHKFDIIILMTDGCASDGDHFDKTMSTVDKHNIISIGIGSIAHNYLRNVLTSKQKHRMILVNNILEIPRQLTKVIYDVQRSM